jgi:hypothetical protein
MTWERGSFKPLRSIRWWLLTVSVLMLGLSSLGLALLFQHNANAFIYHQQDGGSEAYFHVLSSYINVARVNSPLPGMDAASLTFTSCRLPLLGPRHVWDNLFL